MNNNFLLQQQQQQQIIPPQQRSSQQTQQATHSMPHVQSIPQQPMPGFIGSASLKVEPPFPGPVTPESIQSILDANQELIKLCIELQNDPNPSSHQELQKLHARLQKNLNFLASVADHSKRAVSLQQPPS